MKNNYKYLKWTLPVIIIAGLAFFLLSGQDTPEKTPEKDNGTESITTKTPETGSKPGHEKKSLNRRIAETSYENLGKLQKNLNMQDMPVLLKNFHTIEKENIELRSKYARLMGLTGDILFLPALYSMIDEAKEFSFSEEQSLMAPHIIGLESILNIINKCTPCQRPEPVQYVESILLERRFPLRLRYEAFHTLRSIDPDLAKSSLDKLPEDEAASIRGVDKLNTILIDNE